MQQPGLTDLAGALLDAESVDWDRAESAAAGSNNVAVIRALRELSKIEAFHRDIRDEPTPQSLGTSSKKLKLRQWGPLEVVEQIGKGGFGEVYLAQDPDLERLVALKLLRTEREGAPSNEALVKEGRLLARLKHPNIATVYGAGEHDGRVGIWMEFIKGRSLAQLLSEQGPLGEREATLVGIDVCRALAAVHRAGVLHCDVKAQNVMREEGGRYVLTDFGIGREREKPASESPAGTPAYLAPEVLENNSLTIQSDLYSVGVLLYHLVTNEFPAMGRNLDELRQKRKRNDLPSLRDMRPELSTIFCSAVDKSLEVSPTSRFRTAGSMEDALAEVLSQKATASTPPIRWDGSNRPAAAFVRRSRILTALGTVLAVSAIVLLVVPRLTRQPTNPGISSQLTTQLAWHGEPAISPDGRFVVYVSDEGGNEDLWLHTGEGRRIRITENSADDYEPSWSPDGESILFTSDRSGTPAIWRAPTLGGGAALVIENARQPSVSADGSGLAFVRADASGFDRVVVLNLSDPSRVRHLTTAEDGLWDHATPSWSSDGRRIAYSAHGDLWIVPSSSGRPRRLTSGEDFDVEPVWSYDSRFVFFSSDRQGTIAIWRVDVSTGDLRRITIGTGSESSPSVSRDGTRLAYSTTFEDYDLVVRNLDTGAENIKRDSRRLLEPAFTTDAIVYNTDRGDGRFSLWRTRLSNDAFEEPSFRLTNLPGQASHPSSSRDGQWIVFYRVIGDSRDIWTLPTDGGRPIQVTTHPAADTSPVWSPDGRLVAFASQRGETPNSSLPVSRICMAPMDNGHATRPPTCPTDPTLDASFPSFSNDGRSIAYVGRRGAEADVWLLELDSGTSRQLTKGAGAQRVRWHPHDDVIYLVATWGGQRAVKHVSPTDGALRDLAYPLRFSRRQPYLAIDISPDGRLLAYTRQRRRGNIWLLESQQPIY